MAIVEHKTFSRAAAALNMAQPPLSRRIADLEKELGADLFIRGSRQIQLTETGMTLVREARIVLEQARLAERIVRDSIKGISGHIRLGYVGSTGFSIVPSAIRFFRDAHPHATVNVVHLLAAHQFDALRFGTIDVALVGGIVESAGFRKEVLRTNRLVAVLPANHPFADRESIDVADLADEPFLEFPRYGPTGLHDLVRSVCAQSGFVPRVAQEADGLDILVACVAAGIGVALVNDAARTLPIRGVAYKEITPASPPVHLTALSRLTDENPLIASFIEQLKAAAVSA